MADQTQFGCVETQVFAAEGLDAGQPGAVFDPNPVPLQPVFDQQFKGMILREVSVEELNQARASMIQTIGQQLEEDQEALLLSFKSGDPQWDLLKHAIASELPAVQWKLRNIRKMSLARHAQALSRLEQVLCR